MQKGYFIASSGTDIGKTFVTCALTHQAREAGNTVQALKPIISGYETENLANTDTGLLLAAQGLWLDEHFASTISPWRFKAALSPDMAAALEGKHVPYEALLKWCEERKQADGITLIEGVGGVMVPINDKMTTLDWIVALEMPAIVVVGSYLGAMSHALTAIAALVQRNVPIHAVVISETEGSDVTLRATHDSLRHHIASHVPLVALPRCESWDKAPPLLEELKLL